MGDNGGLVAWFSVGRVEGGAWRGVNQSGVISRRERRGEGQARFTDLGKWLGDENSRNQEWWRGLVGGGKIGKGNGGVCGGVGGTEIRDQQEWRDCGRTEDLEGRRYWGKVVGRGEGMEKVVAGDVILGRRNGKSGESRGRW